MKIIWDPRKARANLLKHGIRYSDAEGAFFDPQAITIEDPSLGAERRFVSVGMDSVGRLLVVVFSYRDEDVRLISARRATRSEREQYEASI
jgi:uncharacterized DUF497 family protein